MHWHCDIHRTSLAPAPPRTTLSLKCHCISSTVGDVGRRCTPSSDLRLPDPRGPKRHAAGMAPKTQHQVQDELILGSFLRWMENYQRSQKASYLHHGLVRIHKLDGSVDSGYTGLQICHRSGRNMYIYKAQSNRKSV